MAGPLDTVRRHVRELPRRSAQTAGFLLDSNALVMRWPKYGAAAANWGDKLNPWMAARISGRRVVHAAELYPVARPPVHYWIGSHLGAASGDPRAIIWGAGFISTDAPVGDRAAALRAVRGWRSVEKLRKAGVTPPEVVGDAALLLPRFYTPAPAPRRYALGLIAHFREQDDAFFAAARTWGDVLPIDINGEIETVVDQIASCDRIISSSLHGIICADAYGIPAYWLHSSEKVVGDGFKFHDYFSSVGRPERDPFPVGATTSRAEVEDHFFDYRVQIDLDALWRACPARDAG